MILALTLTIYTIPDVKACAISPAYQISENTDHYLERYNSLFLGKIVDVKNQTRSAQIVEFEVLEILKGSPADFVRVTNIIKTNCSMFFGEVGSGYYVFGNTNPAGDEIHLDGFPSFVSVEYAVETGMVEKLKSN